MLTLAIAYEQASWDEATSIAEQLDIPDWEISGRYVKAIKYSDRVFGSFQSEEEAPVPGAGPPTGQTP